MTRRATALEHSLGSALAFALIHLLALALMIFSLSCAGTASGVRINATGSLNGDVRTDGAGTWAALGEASLIVAATLAPAGPMILVPVRVQKGRLWARSAAGETIDQPITDPIPEWVAALYGPGELDRLIADLQIPSLEP